MKMKRRDILKYFMSYFIVFIIPIVVLSMIILKNFSLLLEKEIKKKSVDDLARIKISLDSNFNEIENSIIGLSKNPYLNYENMMAQDPNSDMVKNIFNTTVNSNKFISEIMLYINNKDYIYTSVGKIPLQSLYNGDLIIKDIVYEDFYDIFNEIKGITYLPSSGLQYYNFVDNNGILIGYPLKKK